MGGVFVASRRPARSLPSKITAPKLASLRSDALNGTTEASVFQQQNKRQPKCTFANISEPNSN